MKKCKIENCDLTHYGKGYCRKHWAQYHRKGFVDVKILRKCAVENCEEITKTKSGLCRFHYDRKCRGFPLDLPKISDKERMLGDKNPRWNNANSEYKNHVLLKRNRLIKLKEFNGKCILCGMQADAIHHINRSKINHELNNLLPVCDKCHFNIFHKNKETKLRKIYGLSIQEISEKYNMTINKCYNLHSRHLLNDFILEKKKLDKPENPC